MGYPFFLPSGRPFYGGGGHWTTGVGLPPSVANAGNNNVGVLPNSQVPAFFSPHQRLFDVRVAKLRILARD